MGSQIAIVAVFVVGALAGKFYGARAEAAGIAEALKVEALVSAEYRTVVSSIKAKTSAALSRIQKYL